MEPRIQYAQTEDGVSIAFWTMGEGTPVVHTPFMVSHIQMEWQFPEYRRWYEGLAERRKLVRYDYRGVGLSDRDVADYSLDSFVLDLEAVVDCLGLERFALFGLAQSGPVAIAYAARHPERVSHLVLWGTYARASDSFGSPRSQVLLRALATDWELFTETLAHVALGWTEGEPARRFAALIRECSTPEGMRAATAGAGELDVAELLPQVRAPTLVLDRRQVRALDLDIVRGLAARIPDARLVLLEGESAGPFLGDTQAVLRAIDEFLGEGEEQLDEPETGLPSGTAIILFLDIADSTALTTKLGDAAYRERERELDASLRAAITGAAGTPVEGKVLGDGVMAVFTSARQAIDAAQRCRDLGNEAGLPLHIGIHAGDVVREGSNVHGGAVQVAARVQSVAAPGEILVSQTVRDLARTSTSAGVEFEDRGEHELKGIVEPQRLFVVREASR